MILGINILFKKIKKYKLNITLLFIFSLALLVRFWDYPNRIIFWTEQARSLITSAEYLSKPSLLGQEYFRQDSNSHIIYSGAMFNYLLLPLLIIFNYDPVKITAFFGLLNVITGFVVYLIAKKFFGRWVGFISAILFLFNDYMIYHSLFIWNYNFLPLVGILTFYFWYKHFKKPSLKNYFVLGILCGIGISIQILFGIFTLLILMSLLIKNSKKIQIILLFSAGVILGNLPMFVFDLRHNFYETSTIIQYFVDTITGKSGAGISYYYFLPLWPIGAILFAKVLSGTNKFVSVFVLLFYVFINLYFPVKSSQFLNVAGIDKSAKLIYQNKSNEFNVASDLDFDKRAYPLRYFLTYKYNSHPLSETEYKEINNLFVLGPKGYNFEKSGTWEIKAGGLTNVVVLSQINNNVDLYKLTK